LENKILALKLTPVLGYVEPENKVRKIFFKMAISDKLSTYIFVVIGLNTLVMCFKWPDMSKSAERTLDFINYGFILIFFGEAFIKIVGLGWRYFRERWNMFDFIIVVFSLLSIII
jgi:hypothetical protein